MPDTLSFDICARRNPELDSSSVNNGYVLLGDWPARSSQLAFASNKKVTDGDAAAEGGKYAGSTSAGDTERRQRLTSRGKQ